MAAVLFLLMMALGCWFLVFSKSHRRRMPRAWWSKLLSAKREEQRDLTDAVILVSALLMAMVFTITAAAALVLVFKNR
jgi:TRAP-type C4-dicarboxylate transport system permease large subunit